MHPSHTTTGHVSVANYYIYLIYLCGSRTNYTGYISILLVIFQLGKISLIQVSREGDKLGERKEKAVVNDREEDYFLDLIRSAPVLCIWEHRL